MRFSRSILLMFLTMVLFFSFVTSASAEYGYVQDDPDNPTKFSIDERIAQGFATDDLYIGTTQAYLGDKANGKTPIFQEGLGVHPADILITNGKVGIVLAIGTADPWGYPGGSILDAGRVEMPQGSTDWSQATFGKDTVLTCQFLFNNWDAWAPVNSGMVWCDLVKYNFETKALDEQDGTWAVQINRKFTVPDSGVDRDFDVTSYYSIDPGAEHAYMYDQVKNNRNVAVDVAVTNQLSLSNKGGDGIDTTRVASLSAANTYNWVADKNGDPERAFSTTLICPGENLDSNGNAHPFSGFSGATGYREFNFADIEYAPNEQRTYESYLMIDDQCSWQNVYDFWSDYKGLETFNISGNVKDVQGKTVKYPVVLVYRGDEFFGWVMGDENGAYSVDLPKENDTQEYNLRVEVKDTVTGAPCENFTSAAAGSTIELTAGEYKIPVTFNFVDAETGEPVWGRVMVGSMPTAAFTGKSYFFSDNTSEGELEDGAYGPGTKEVVKGKVTAMVAPGDYTATCYGEGYNFSSYIEGTKSGSVQIKGNTNLAAPTIEVSFSNPTPKNWYSIDNHHHGQRMDAFSPPEVVAKAQVTAGLDVLTLDDHEFVLDNWPVYQWGQKMDIVGYMPSEEVTASWAHFDIMPLTVDCYEQYLDRDQENNVVNTNQSLRGIIDQGHLFGASIGAMHPTSSYGMLLADKNNTVPGGLIDDFDGLESQFSANHNNEAMAYWNAYVKGGSHRNVEVERPHYIWGSTDIHQSGTSAGSGSTRSYVFLENGEAVSEENFDRFGLEFARSEALGHSFNSNGVYIIPDDEGLMYGETYWADANGNFKSKFDISALENITNIYVFSSLGTKTVDSGEKLPFNGFENCLSIKAFSDGEQTNNVQDFTVNLANVKGKQWFSLGAVSSNGKMALTNPIWVNGPNVKEETITKVSFQNPPTLPEELNHGETLEVPTSAGILITEPWSVRIVEDWTLKGADFGDTVVGGKAYTYNLTFTAPEGYVFSQNLATKDNGFTVSSDGATLVYSQKIKAKGSANISSDDITLGQNGMGTANPTKNQWQTWIKDAQNNVVFNFPDLDDLQSMTGFVLTVDPDELKDSSLKIILPDNTGVTIPAAVWDQIIAASKGDAVEISVISKNGGIVTSLKQGDKDITLAGSNAIVYEIPYAAKDGEKADYIVAKSDKDVIARSWYSQEDSVLYAKTSVFGEYKPAYVEPQSFTDTKGRWMDPAVTYLRTRGVAQGVGDNVFNADSNITRAEFTTLFVRMMDLKAGPKAPIVFNDADKIPAYAKECIDIASSYELVEGYQNNFSPNDSISRQEMFVITYRALNKLNLLPATIPDKEVTFADLDTVAAYAKESITVLTKLGLVDGYDDNTVRPREYTKRGECAQFLYNVLELDR